MVVWRLLLIVSAFGVAPGGAAADQRDPRLNALFDKLKLTNDPSVGSTLTRQIWEIWFTPPNQRIGVMLTNGIALMHRRRLGAAIAQLSAVIREAPEFAEGWNRRAVARFIAGDLDGSLSDISRTLALEPRHFGALAGMAMIYVRRRQYRNALAAYRRALAVNPHQPSVRRSVRRLSDLLRERDI